MSPWKSEIPSCFEPLRKHGHMLWRWRSSERTGLRHGGSERAAWGQRGGGGRQAAPRLREGGVGGDTAAQARGEDVGKRTEASRSTKRSIRWVPVICWVLSFLSGPFLLTLCGCIVGGATQWNERLDFKINCYKYPNSFIPDGRNSRQRSLVGHSPCGHKELDTTECMHTHTHARAHTQTQRGTLRAHL